MKILFISAYFAHKQAIGAKRSQELVKYLIEQGHEVVVVSAEIKNAAAFVPEIEVKNHIVSWKDSNVNNIVQKKFSFAGNFFTKCLHWFIERPKLSALSKKYYRSFIYWPDRYQFWITKATNRALNISGSFKPDLIYSSALPFSSHIVASRTAKRLNIPWVAEFRDQFSSNFFNETVFFRNVIDRFWEKSILKGAQLLVAVNEDMKIYLEELHHKKCICITNGFKIKDARQTSTKKKNKVFTIVYTGAFYDLKRDPRTFFAALEMLKQENFKFKFNIFTSDWRQISYIKSKFDLEKEVTVSPEVPSDHAQRYQSNSDLLLLIMWLSKKQGSILPGKFFEYLSTGVPILAIERKERQLSQHISNYKLGYAASTKLEIYEILKVLIREHQKEQKSIAQPLENELEFLSQRYQFGRLKQHLSNLIH